MHISYIFLLFLVQNYFFYFSTLNLQVDVFWNEENDKKPHFHLLVVSSEYLKNHSFLNFKITIKIMFNVFGFETFIIFFHHLR